MSKMKARFMCWLKGHKVARFKYAVVSGKKYHGHDEVRDYVGCRRCGAGSPQKELSYYSSENSLYERHDAFFGVSLAILAFLVFIFVITVFVMAGQAYSCKVNAEIMELPWKFHWVTGNCYYEFEGRWIARNLLTVVDLLK